MIRNRISRIVASLGLAMSLTLSLVALPGVILAATPEVTVWNSGPVPGTVAPGEPVAFTVYARNDDTSTVSQFYLRDLTAGTVLSATPSKGSCQQTEPLDCSLGQLKPGVTVSVLVVYLAPASGSSMPVTWVFSTTGLGSGGPDSDNSHGDEFPTSSSVSLNASADFGGRYVNTNSQTTVQNGQTLGPSNKQSTIVFSPETGIGVTVEDGPGAGGDGGCGSGATCFSETSAINVNNGASYENGFKVVVNLHSSQIPSGVNANNLVVYHDGVQITDKCGKTPDPDCYSVKKFSWGLQVTIWLTQNGNIKFA